MSLSLTRNTTTGTHETVPTTFIDVKGTKFAYRSFGQPEGIPIVFLQHFTGTLDNWDPALTNELAKTHPIILFDNKGVGSIEGETPATVAKMADDAYAFIRALGLKKVYLLGFSLGGFIAQNLAEAYPELVSKVILAGTGPKGSEGITDIVNVVIAGMSDGPAKVLRNIFFTKTAIKQRRICRPWNFELRLIDVALLRCHQPSVFTQDDAVVH